MLLLGSLITPISGAGLEMFMILLPLCLLEVMRVRTLPKIFVLPKNLSPPTPGNQASNGLLLGT